MSKKIKPTMIMVSVHIHITNGVWDWFRCDKFLGVGILFIKLVIVVNIFGIFKMRLCGIIFPLIFHDFTGARPSIRSSCIVQKLICSQ